MSTKKVVMIFGEWELALQAILIPKLQQYMAENIQPFIKVDNRFFFQKNEITNQSEISEKFRVIGTEGFTIYCYLMHRQGSSSSAEISIKMITAVIGKIDGLKDVRTIKKYINLLRINLFIKIHNFDSLDEIGVNDIMVVSCNDQEYSEGFLAVPSLLYIKKVRHIGHIGWSILCLLGKLHNKNFGCDECQGFAYVSEETIAKIIDRGTTSVKKYLDLLVEFKLIRIEPQDRVFIGYDDSGVGQFKYAPNHYIVHFRGTPESKYYLDLGGSKSGKNKADQHVTP